MNIHNHSPKYKEYKTDKYTKEKKKFAYMFFVGSVISIISHASMAGEITNLNVTQQTVETGQTVDINIDLTKNDAQFTNSQSSSSILGVGAPTDSQTKTNKPCAVLVNFGDGHTEHIKVDADSSSFKVSHTYNNSGDFAISAEGKILIRGLKSVFGCSGNTLTYVLTVKNAAIAKTTDNLESPPTSEHSITKIETKGMSNKELVKRGITAYNSKQYEDANTLLSAAIKQKPNGIVNFYLGLTLKELNQKELAIANLKSSLKSKLSGENRQLAKQAILSIYAEPSESVSSLTLPASNETPVFILDEPSKNNTSDQIITSNSAPQHISFNQLADIIKKNQSEKTMNRALVIDYLPTIIHELDSLGGTSKGKKSLGFHEEPNPAWDAANQRVIDAQKEAKASVQDNEKIQAQLKQTGGDNGLASLFVAAVGLVPVYTKNNAYMEAKKDLDTTPRTLSIPSYSDFSYPIVNKEIKRIDRVVAYLIDFSKGLASVREFKKVDSAKILITQSDQNTDSSPREKDEYRQAKTKIENLKDITRQPILLSSVIDESSGDFKSYKPLGKLNNLPDKISRAHANAALESKKVAELNNQNASNFEKAISRFNNVAMSKNPNVNMQSISDQTVNNKMNNSNIQKTEANPSNSSACIDNFEYLAAKYPTFREPKLQEVKDSITAQTVKDIISSAKSQGFTADAAIEASNLQANEYKKSYKQALACAVSVDAFGNDEEAFIAMINRNKDVLAGGIRDTCLAAAIGFQMGYMHAKTVASALVCNKRRGTY